jgi:hypothetical protein
LYILDVRRVRKQERWLEELDVENLRDDRDSAGRMTLGLLRDAVMQIGC